MTLFRTKLEDLYDIIKGTYNYRNNAFLPYRCYIYMQYILEKKQIQTDSGQKAVTPRIAARNIVF